MFKCRPKIFDCGKERDPLAYYLRKKIAVLQNIFSRKPRAAGFSLRNKIFFGVFLLIIGLVLLFFPTIYKAYINFESAGLKGQADQTNNFSTEETGSSSASLADEPIRPEKGLKTTYLPEELPVRIIIPNLKIDLPVRPSAIIDGIWQTSEETASFGLGSTAPGKVGNTVIFAHSRWNLFGPLSSIRKDNLIFVLTRKTWFAYKVEEIKTVFPTQLEVIAKTEEQTLTLYTCSGFADTRRLIVTAKRTEF
jgi:LPXTG-site transpeptidase (sortase) family protein